MHTESCRRTTTGPRRLGEQFRGRRIVDEVVDQLAGQLVLRNRRRLEIRVHADWRAIHENIPASARRRPRADLGIRLHKAGYKTAIVDSTTLEEANSDLQNWIRQRSRWIKGYIQTYLVHMRHPFKLFRQIGLKSFISLDRKSTRLDSSHRT